MAVAAVRSEGCDKVRTPGSAGEILPLAISNMQVSHKSCVFLIV